MRQVTCNTQSSFIHKKCHKLLFFININNSHRSNSHSNQCCSSRRKLSQW